MGMEKKKTRSSNMKIEKRMRDSCPISLIVSSYDSLEQLQVMYNPFVENNIKKLYENHADLFFEIDATKLNLPEVINQVDPMGLKFDRIVWNFPHSGFPEQGDGAQK